MLPVFLWSIAGAENGLSLMAQFPELTKIISGCFSKENFPIELIDNPFAIDDEGVDPVVLRCHHVILGETYEGGEDSGTLIEAAEIIVAAIKTLK